MRAHLPNITAFCFAFLILFCIFAGSAQAYSGSGGEENPYKASGQNGVFNSGSAKPGLPSLNFALSSKLLDGNNSRAASAMERNRDWLGGSLGHELANAYTTLGSSSSKDEMDSRARGLTPHATTLLGPMAVNRFDMVQGLLFSNLRKKGSCVPLQNPLGSATLRLIPKPPKKHEREPGDYLKLAILSGETDPLATPGDGIMSTPNWNAWLSPLSSFERYDAKSASFTDTSGSILGGSFGLTRHFKDYSLGISGFLTQGAPSGGGWLADVQSYGFLAGLRTRPLNIGIFTPWLEAGAGYSYTIIKQSRDDILGGGHDSAPRQHGTRLTASLGQDFNFFGCLSLSPVLGIDYTYTLQSGYAEDGGDLRLAVGKASMHSIRPRLGGEFTLSMLENLSLNAHAFLRHELGDRGLNLQSAIVNTPVHFNVKGEKYTRSSGNGGVALNWQALETVNLSAHYEVIVGDRYPGYYIHNPVSPGLEGESCDGSTGNGGLALNWQLDASVSLSARYDAILDGDEPGGVMNAVLTWEF